MIMATLDANRKAPVAKTNVLSLDTSGKNEKISPKTMQIQ
jgi:hypothetical protein